MKPLTIIAQEIHKLQTKKPCVIVAIDGRSGSGKSSFAKKLQEFLPESRIVHLDEFDLYEGSPNIQRLIEKVISPLITNSKKAEIVILEGVFALREKLLAYYDYKIWVDCPKEIGFERGLKRDIALNGIDNSDRWRDYWLPKEEEYIASENPHAKADVVVDGNM
ncbi:hypothetical protein A3B02_02245 [Candidatus Roizmanbacteria bacterium RIFCSPLOWO2_01_FULL_42_14]|uniref:Phosphoribulokinase/uridine kinase domain-containing protein n=3 Tax=Candidatus Roizmaniibacteriota TaxID=1752723 RepID=A0A1F7JXF0_9BACT|nr:MAG: hypothetical protein A3D08_01160 [Candidatus Roizmanbacteria bacterium RIFCSPHIGHO2_02_FULL_43_11]OGK51943.1 MAG: hypothetical protein A3B02_02245 [Candidatus Roizmanbacteria bacterium RIFCSPLOWO2_01_FULL_42_14]OGK60292.1 MAG: hypothetical protein A3I56_04340 [Candidatus Roizmanbacteria bacterium RIFCSPLOWO2_02_FULL_43_10]